MIDLISKKKIEEKLRKREVMNEVEWGGNGKDLNRILRKKMRIMKKEESEVRMWKRKIDENGEDIKSEIIEGWCLNIE